MTTTNNRSHCMVNKDFLETRLFVQPRSICDPVPEPSGKTNTGNYPHAGLMETDHHCYLRLHTLMRRKHQYGCHLKTGTS